MSSKSFSIKNIIKPFFIIILSVLVFIFVNDIAAVSLKLFGDITLDIGLSKFSLIFGANMLAFLTAVLFFSKIILALKKFV